MTMTYKQLKLAEGKMVEYWHPRKGGWHRAWLIRAGHKWATVQKIVPKGAAHRRIPMGNVRESFWNPLERQ
jgi:hypothetical protein